MKHKQTSIAGIVSRYNDILKPGRKRPLLQGARSDASNWSLILIPLCKGHVSGCGGHY